MRHSVHLSLKSGNKKTGKIPVTTTPRSTCPIQCSHRGTSCYFENVGSAIFWTHLDRAAADPSLTYSHSDSRGRSYSTNAIAWDGFVAMVDRGELPRGLARFGQGGDLPGDGTRIDRKAVIALAKASKRAGVRWIAYTHYVWASPSKRDFDYNVTTLRLARKAGMSINVSCDTMDQVDQTRALGLPSVVTAPSTFLDRTSKTAGGSPLSQCPATYRDSGVGSSCESCGGCAIDSDSRRTYVFPAHGSGKKAIDSRLALFKAQGVN